MTQFSLDSRSRLASQPRPPARARCSAPWIRGGVARARFAFGLRVWIFLWAILPVVTRDPLAAAEKSDGTKAAEEKIAVVTFDTIKLDMKKGNPFKRELLTDAVKKLDGKQIRIRGYILPSFQQTGIKQFVLVRDNMECCFGPGALLFDCIMVEMTDDGTTDYTVRPVTVEGKFSIKEVLGPDEKHLAIYRLDAKSVK